MRRSYRIHRLLQLWGQYKAVGLVVVDGNGLVLSHGDEFKLNAIEFEAIYLNKIKSVDSFIQSLIKTQQRLVFGLYVWNKSIEEMAGLLGISKKSVHNQMCKVDIQMEEWLRENAANPVT